MIPVHRDDGDDPAAEPPEAFEDGSKFRKLRNPSPADDTADRDRKLSLDLMTGMKRTIDELRRDNWRRIADQAARDAVPKVWRPLKAAALDVEPPGCSERQRKANYENVRTWCELGVIFAEKRGGRWFVRMDSLHAHVAALRGK